MTKTDTKRESTVANTHTTGYYFAPPSHWPVVGSLALFFMAIGGVLLMNSHGIGWAPFSLGFFILVYMLFGWFGQVIRESEGGLFNQQVDMSFRWAMSWFIFSEVMFFAAFFGALFYARVFSVPWLGGEGTKVMGNELLHPLFENAWPTNGPMALGPRDNGSFELIPAFGLPAINTIILLLSGVTVTIAHHALRAGKRGVLNLFLFLTFALGFLFVYLQATESAEAYQHLALQLATGIYGSPS